MRKSDSTLKQYIIERQRYKKRIVGRRDMKTKRHKDRKTKDRKKERLIDKRQKERKTERHKDRET